MDTHHIHTALGSDKVAVYCQMLYKCRTGYRAGASSWTGSQGARNRSLAAGCERVTITTTRNHFKDTVPETQHTCGR